MSIYSPFEEWFENQLLSTKEIALTFTEIDKIISFNLPACARKNFTSWANFHAPLQDCWLNTGWRTVMVDIENGKVKFKRSKVTLAQ